jgi:tRNA G18 (ribose-2'-O)-methylase SpoU
MKKRVATVPNLSDGSKVHSDAIAAGTDHFSSWSRNVIDEFKPLSIQEIKAKLAATAYPFAVCFENWIGDFNFSSGIRNANGFNAKEVFYLGNKRYDKRGAQGTYAYTDVQFLSTVDELTALKSKYVFVGADNIKGAVSLVDYKWAKNSLIIFGSEGVGLTPAVQAMCDDMVAIPMSGSVRSFNCGTSSGILMYDYVSKFKQ